MNLLSQEDVLKIIKSQKNSFWPSYRAFYSSWFGGIVTDPSLMMVPVDDHLVHRGDGVFEALRSIQGRLWLQEAHIDRLFQSAQKIGLAHPFSKEQILETIQKTLVASGLEDSLIRVFLSRGPGSFSTNPYDSMGAQLYVVVCDFKAPPQKWFDEGVTVRRSKIPAKDPWLAQIKSCNYLQNVLMKKEAVDLNCDFVVGADSVENLTESSTENIFWLDSNNYLCHPLLDKILSGTTMAAVFCLAQEKKLVSGIKEASLPWRDLSSQKAFFMVGTTLDVLPVKQIEDQKFSDFDLAQKLRDALLEKQGLKR